MGPAVSGGMALWLSLDVVSTESMGRAIRARPWTAVSRLTVEWLTRRRAIGLPRPFCSWAVKQSLFFVYGRKFCL
jgi:hypothetical protein